jgi:Helix-turn-helix domain
LSIQAMTWVFEFSESRLAARHVLLSIANHADREGKNAWPSIETIAREARLSPREVQRSIPELVTLGELVAAPNQGPHGTYGFSLPKMSPRQVVTPTIEPSRGDIYAKKGDQLSPEPSLTVQEPSGSAPNFLNVEYVKTQIAQRRAHGNGRRLTGADLESANREAYDAAVRGVPETSHS